LPSVSPRQPALQARQRAGAPAHPPRALFNAVGPSLTQKEQKANICEYFPAMPFAADAGYWGIPGLADRHCSTFRIPRLLISGTSQIADMFTHHSNGLILARKRHPWRSRIWSRAALLVGLSLSEMPFW